MTDTSPLAILEPLLQDPAVTEIMIDGPGRVTVERRGSPVPELRWPDVRLA